MAATPPQGPDSIGVIVLTQSVTQFCERGLPDAVNRRQSPLNGPFGAV